MLPTNRATLREYVLQELGSPIIKIELGVEQLDNAIDLAIFKFVRVAYSDYTEYVETTDSETQVPRLRTIKCVLDEANKEIPYEFNPIKRIIKCMNARPKYRIIGYADYEWADDDPVFREQWVHKYATARAKYLWGQIVGKYTQALVGGAEINYDRILTEAIDELAALEEELNDKWQSIAPAIVY